MAEGPKAIAVKQKKFAYRMRRVTNQHDAHTDVFVHTGLWPFCLAFAWCGGGGGGGGGGGWWWWWWVVGGVFLLEVQYSILKSLISTCVLSYVGSREDWLLDRICES